MRVATCRPSYGRLCSASVRRRVVLWQTDICFNSHSVDHQRQTTSGTLGSGRSPTIHRLGHASRKNCQPPAQGHAWHLAWKAYPSLADACFCVSTLTTPAGSKQVSPRSRRSKRTHLLLCASHTAPWLQPRPQSHPQHSSQSQPFNPADVCTRAFAPPYADTNPPLTFQSEAQAALQATHQKRPWSTS